MKRVVWTLVGLVVVVVLLCLPVLFFGRGSTTENTETTTITDYRAAFDLARSGDLRATETLTVNFPGYGKHGIFRYWDRDDAGAPHARRDPEDISVTMDGRPEPFTLSEEGHGRFEVAKIGDPDTTVEPGDHTYVIGYRIDGVIDADDRRVTGSTAPSMFYWNLIPPGWQQPIRQAELTVNLPVAAQQEVRCAIGSASSGSSSGCTVQGGGTRALTVDTGAVAARTPVTIATALDLPTPPAGHTVPWSWRWDQVLSRHPLLLALVLVLAVGAFALGSLLGARSREKSPPFPLLYAPPDGLGPAQGRYLYGEDVDNQTYVATLMWAAEKGAIDLARDGKRWTITDRAGAQGWTGLDDVTAGVAHLLGGPGSSFTASPRDVAAGRRLKSEIAAFESRTRTWGQTSGLMTSSGLGGLGGLVVLAGFALVAVSVFWNPLDMSMAGLVPGAFAVGGTSLAAKGAGTRRTRRGRDVWSQVGGFRRILATPSSKARFDFASRKDLYVTYLPWAVALGCADEWAEKYRTEMGGEPPVPHYFGGFYAGAATGGFVTSMVDSFDSTVSSAISSYNATQSSSSGGGGGGFSGGGGGGGGGGGSW